MKTSDDILLCREKKHNFIKQYVLDHQVVTLKANIVGENKNMKEAYILLSYFDKLIPNTYITKYVMDDADGPLIIYLFSKEKNLKEEMVLLEQNTPLGRFIDIDVYYNSDISLNRSHLRKCYLCDSPAFVCGRLKRHTTDDLNNYLKQQVENHLLSIINDFSNSSILKELHLHPKFGLVTPYTNGSHIDMDYSLMIKAKDAILPYFSKMFLETYKNDNLEDLFTRIRKIGIEAENNMFQSTKQINAYKGLIFALGLIISGVTFNFTHPKDKTTIFDFVKIITKGISKELDQGNDTFGKLAYQKYGIKGARFEAENGFLNVQKVLEQFDLETDESCLQALMFLIANIDDTVLLKRCNDINKYNLVKDKFKNFKFGIDDINELNEYCLNNNLSFGGSADLLIVCVFIKKIYKTFNLNLFKNQ